MPWDRNLGAPRVQLELAEELSRRGHHVDKFDVGDAFPGRPRSRLRELIGPSFAARAARFVREVGSGYDVIDAQQGNLPYTKDTLGFRGLLVARSCGLYRFYRDFERESRRRWPNHQGSVAGRIARRLTSLREESRERESLERADLINLLNPDELRFVTEQLGLGDKCVVLPNGIDEVRAERLRSAAASPGERLAAQEIAFIGHWSPRKGALDWADIAGRVCRDAPGVRFSFFGTGESEERVRHDLGPIPSHVRVVPRFETSELPVLLENTTVGALPSYIEGFGLGVLEKLAARIPSVAYDVPGPRETLGKVDRSLLTPRGDTDAFARRIVRILRCSEREYGDLAERCDQVAAAYSWSQITDATLDAYAARLAK